MGLALLGSALASCFAIYVLERFAGRSVNSSVVVPVIAVLEATREELRRGNLAPELRARRELASTGALRHILQGRTPTRHDFYLWSLVMLIGNILINVLIVTVLVALHVRFVTAVTIGLGYVVFWQTVLMIWFAREVRDASRFELI